MKTLIRRQKRSGRGQGCWHCGRPGHLAAKCLDKKDNSIEDTKATSSADSLPGLVMLNSVSEEHPELVQQSYKILTGVDSGAFGLKRPRPTTRLQLIHSQADLTRLHPVQRSRIRDAARSPPYPMEFCEEHRDEWLLYTRTSLQCLT